MSGLGRARGPLAHTTSTTSPRPTSGPRRATSTSRPAISACGRARSATRSDAAHDEVARAISQQEPLSVELLYSDQAGAQRTITRFTLVPIRRDDADRGELRLISGGRHWYLDRAGPR